MLFLLEMIRKVGTLSFLCKRLNSIDFVLMLVVQHIFTPVYNELRSYTKVLYSANILLVLPLLSIV